MQRYHIISCAKRGKSQAEMFRLLQEVYRDEALSVTTCRRWYLRAKMGDTSGHDWERLGCKPTTSTLANVRAVGAILDEDRHATVHQITAEVNISTGSMHKLLHRDMNLTKKALKFVPRILTTDQKKQQVAICKENLKVCEDPLFLWTVITGDESWISVLEPEQKQQSLRVSRNDPIRRRPSVPDRPIRR